MLVQTTASSVVKEGKKKRNCIENVIKYWLYFGPLQCYFVGVLTFLHNLVASFIFAKTHSVHKFGISGGDFYKTKSC